MDVTKFLSAKTRSKIPYDCMLDIIAGGEAYVKYQIESQNKYKRLKYFSISDNRLIDNCFTAIHTVMGRNAKDICSKGRDGNLPMCRYIISKYLSEEKQMSLVDIGKVFNRHHSTIINSRDKHWNNEFDAQFIENYGKFLSLMKNL